MPSDALLLPRSLCACPPVGTIIAWRTYPHPGELLPHPPSPSLNDGESAEE